MTKTSDEQDPDEDDLDSDLGLQVERTSLAWSRTVLAAAALAGVSIKSALDRAEVVLVVVAVGTTVVLAGFWGCAQGRRARMLADRTTAAWPIARIAAAGCVVANLLALVIVFVDIS